MPMPNDHDRPPRPAQATGRPATSAQLTSSLQRSSGSFELTLAPVLMALLGLWLDRTVGTVPVFTVCLAVLGMAGAAASLYYRYDRSMRRLHRAPGRVAR